MIVSVNWLKKFVDIDLPIDQLVSLIGERLVEVEGIEDLSEKYKDVVVAKVVSSEKMENSDHLSLVFIDDGGVVEGVERTQEGHIQIVCGAPNVVPGMLIAWLPPKSIVPETFGTDDPFVLAARPLRGYVSNGMIASARELDLYDEHDGILAIDKQAEPGASFADLYDLNDTLIDIENKSLTHRPDAFGLIGFAREVAGIQGKQFKTPDWLRLVDGTTEPTKMSLELPRVAIEDSSLSGRFQLVVIDGVSEGTLSSIQMQTYLSRSGVRPINALVDISNYIMILTGQPTHMYDYDKLRSVAGNDFTVSVRLASSDEKLTLLDNKEITMDTSDIVIAAGNTPIGLAGIMGGLSTATDASTKTVVLEVATFDLYHMRSSQMRHGIFSEAVTRYTKGVPVELGRPVLLEVARMVQECAGDIVVSQPIDDYPGRHEPITVPVESSRINGLLGTQFSSDDIAQILGNVEFNVEFDDLTGKVTVPYWRNDIKIPEDIAEEVGRLSGFDSINTSMPVRDFTAVHATRFDTIRSRLRSALVRAGLNEVLTYSFVHGDLISKAGQSVGNSYRITNSISPELQYYRQSLAPSLVQHVYPNIRLGYDSFGIFEFNKVHEKSSGLTSESVPVERDVAALVIANSKATGQTAYYQAKYMLEYMLKSIGLKVEFVSLEGCSDELSAAASVFEPKRSACVKTEGGAVLGVVGEYKASIYRDFKLPSYSAGFEVFVDSIAENTPHVAVEYNQASKYPSVERDVCFKVDSDINYSDVYTAVTTSLNGVDLDFTVDPIDIYKPEGGDTKNITFRIVLVSHAKTLTSDEVASVIDIVCKNVISKFSAEVV